MRLSRLVLTCLLPLAVLPAHAQTADEAARAAERARAEALEAEGKALRAEAEATYEATLPGCYDRFLVNRCIDQAKKKRLETVQRARALEAESRRITLAERQRVAAEAGARADRPLTPAAPNALPATPATQPASSRRLRSCVPKASTCGRRRACSPACSSSACSFLAATLARPG